MSYKIKDIRLVIREERDSSDSNLYNYNLKALVDFSYNNSEYSIICQIEKLFDVQMEDNVSKAGKIKSVTSSNDPSSISKSDIDEAIATAIEDEIEQIDLKSKVNALNYSAHSYKYAYPMDI